MTRPHTTKPYPWLLMIKRKGKDIQAGRWPSDLEAQRWAEMMGIKDYRVVYKPSKAT